MTTAQIETPGVRLALSEAKRQRALVEAVVTPELRKMMSDHGKQMSEALDIQVKLRDMLPPSLEAMMREQNQRIAEMLDNVGIRRALASIEFNLPDGMAEQITAYRDQVTSEVAAEEEAELASGLGRLAEEREAIIVGLRRIGQSLEGLKFIPDLPFPVSIIVFSLCILVVIAEVADDLLSEKEDDD